MSVFILFIFRNGGGAEPANAGSFIRGLCFAASYGGIAGHALKQGRMASKKRGFEVRAAPALHQAVGELQFAGTCFCVKLSGTTISRLLSCVELLGTYN